MRPGKTRLGLELRVALPWPLLSLAQCALLGKEVTGNPFWCPELESLDCKILGLRAILETFLLCVLFLNQQGKVSQKQHLFWNPILHTKNNKMKLSFCYFPNTCLSSLFRYLTCFPMMFYKFTSRAFGINIKSLVLASLDGSVFTLFHGYWLAL